MTTPAHRPPPLRRLAVGLLVLLACALSGTAVAGAAETQARVLGPRGEIYQLQAGSLGELFAGVHSSQAAHPALALEILRRDQIERLVVPGTEGEEAETSASAVFEPQSATLYLAWATRFHLLHSRITILSYHEGEWSAPIEIAGSAFSEKSVPRIAFTRESFTDTAADGTPVERTRSIVHTLWTETTGFGERVVYTPVVFVDGVPIDDIPELTLDPRLVVADGQLGALPDVPLPPTLTQAGASRLLASLGDDELLSVLTIDPVPLELTRLGGAVRASIVPIGRLLCSEPDGLVRLAAAARTNVLSEGGPFHASVLQHVAEAVEHRVRASAAGCGGGLEGLASAVYEEIVEAGSDALSGGGMMRTGAGVRASIVPIGRSGAGGPSSGVDHRIRIGRASTHRTPPVGGGRAHVLPAADGRRVVVAWETEGALAYSESAGAAWSEPNELRIDEHLDLASALELLERRASGR
ncbi:MAG TPA: hypothetical protein VMT85_13635 [Thermoanaerobaculia bacterium]|nr:hypothetical protein [Thermoanaerobaculia bacterium]